MAQDKGKGKGTGGRGKGQPAAGAAAAPFVKGISKGPPWTCGGCGQSGIWRCRTECHHCGAAPPRAVKNDQEAVLKGGQQRKGNTALERALAGEKAARKELEALKAKGADKASGDLPADDDDLGPGVLKTPSTKKLVSAFKEAQRRLDEVNKFAQDVPNSVSWAGIIEIY